MKENYVIIGGSPFRCYTGTVTYTGLSVVGKTNTLKQAEKLIRKEYDNYGGLMIIIDLNTGEVVYE